MQDYLNLAITLVAKIQGNGKTIKNHTFLNFLINGLPEAYKPHLLYCNQFQDNTAIIKNALLEAKSTIKAGKKEAKKKANAYALATKHGGKGKGGGQGGKGASSTNFTYYRCGEKGHISTNCTAKVIKKTLETPKAKVAQKEKDNNNKPQHFLMAHSIPDQWIVGDDWTLQNLAAKTIVDITIRQSEQRQPETIAICANGPKMYGKDRNNLEVSAHAHFNKHKRNRTLSGNGLKAAKKALNT
jgi:hypothetical protein